MLPKWKQTLSSIYCLYGTISIHVCYICVPIWYFHASNVYISLFYCITIEKQTLFYRYKSDNTHDPKVTCTAYYAFSVFFDCFIFVFFDYSHGNYVNKPINKFVWIQNWIVCDYFNHLTLIIGYVKKVVSGNTGHVTPAPTHVRTSPG